MERLTIQNQPDKHEESFEPVFSSVNSKISTISRNPIYQYVLLALITVLAASLRFYKLGEWSFWIDEIYTVGRVQAHYSSLETSLLNIPPYRNWIPLSVILTGNVFSFMGTNEWSARLVPALIGVISIPLLYFPIKRAFDSSVALLTSLLLAVSSWHIYWSQNARGYTSLMLFSTLALFAFFFGLERDRVQYFLLFIVFFYLAISERLVGLFIVPVMVLYLTLLAFLPISRPPGFRLKNALIVIVPIILLGIYEVYSFFSTGQSILYSIYSEVISTFLGHSIEDPFTQATLILMSIGIGLVTVSFFSGLYLASEKSRAGLLMFLGAIVPFVIVVLVTPFTFTEERYAFITLPFWLILAAAAVKELFRITKDHEKLLALGVLMVLLAEAGVANLMYFHVNNGNRRDWRGALYEVQERSTEDDIIISTWPPLAEYYLGKEVLSWRETDANFVRTSGKDVWFVIIPDMAWAWGNEDFLWWVENNSELIDVSFLRRPDNATIYIYHYNPERNSNIESTSK